MKKLSEFSEFKEKFFPDREKRFLEHAQKDQQKAIAALKPGFSQSVLKNGFHYACEHGFLQLATRLMELGVPATSLGEKHRYTPLEAAIAYGHKDVARLLVEKSAGAVAHRESGGGDSPLGCALRKGRQWALELLHEQGVDVTVLKGKPSLVCIAEEGNGPDLVAPLIEAFHADVNACDERGETALHKAAYRDDASLCRRLIEKYGADKNAQSKTGQTPLMKGVSNRYQNSTEYLIECGADINLQDKQGDTALLIAVRQKDAKAVRLLIEAGADIHLRNNEGLTAETVAKKNGLEEIRLLLIENKHQTGADESGFMLEGRDGVSRQKTYFDGQTRVREIFDFNARRQILTVFEDSQVNVKITSFADMRDKVLVHQAYKAFIQLGGSAVNWETPVRDKDKTELPELDGMMLTRRNAG